MQRGGHISNISLIYQNTSSIPPLLFRFHDFTLFFSFSATVSSLVSLLDTVVLPLKFPPFLTRLVGYGLVVVWLGNSVESLREWIEKFSNSNQMSGRDRYELEGRWRRWEDEWSEVARNQDLSEVRERSSRESDVESTSVID